MKKDHANIPLYHRLADHYEKGSISYHVPGHKSGNVFPSVVSQDFINFLKYDLTEINGLDDLHDPEEVIKEAQQLTSQLYGVKNTYFLVNGSTVGNLAAILSLCEEKDTIIVQRDSHKSVFNAIKLSKVNAVFVASEIDPRTHLSIGINVDTIEQAIKLAPTPIKAIVITNPSYYGISKNLTDIIQLAHRYHIPVIVDEAHGAHFIIGSPFPISAVELGADIVIQSAHKTLPAMTMGSYLHTQGSLFDEERLQFYLRALQSSSPSYPIMASLDFARYYIEELRKEDMKSLERQLINFYRLVNQIDTLSTVHVQQPNVVTDLLKMTLSSSIMTGYELQRALEEEGIYTELADPLYVLLVLPLSLSFDFHETILKMQRAVAKQQKNQAQTFLIEPFSFSNEVVLKPFSQDNKKEKELVPLTESVNRICTQSIIPYPPGIPILMEGEVITALHIQYLKQIIALKGKIQGSPLSEKGLINVFV
ncbi:aminotransferase class I/II-fold pyridoxal phosphate-dependent enzyme [Priestia megaterium]|nr:aminotransferase class I/II-fold pyridoxal phosphate-dependent enzyme [Priestia megaterium]